MRRNVGRFGNRVGGTVTVRADRIGFSMNALDAAVRTETGSLDLPLHAVRAARLGRLSGLFTTVDVEHEGGVLRLRCWGRADGRLRAAIEAAASRAGVSPS